MKNFEIFQDGISLGFELYRRDGVVVIASASQSVDLGFNPLVDSYQKT